MSPERAWSEDESRLSFDVRFDLCALQVTCYGYVLSETACDKNHDVSLRKKPATPARLQKTVLSCQTFVWVPLLRRFHSLSKLIEYLI